MRRVTKRGLSRRGQGMTENIITVALIAIASISAVTLFGDNIRILFGASADTLAGDTRVTNGAKKSPNDPRTLKNFAAGVGAGGVGRNSVNTGRP